MEETLMINWRKEAGDFNLWKHCFQIHVTPKDAGFPGFLVFMDGHLVVASCVPMSSRSFRLFQFCLYYDTSTRTKSTTVYKSLGFRVTYKKSTTNLHKSLFSLPTTEAKSIQDGRCLKSKPPRWMHQICSAIRHLHERDICHLAQIHRTKRAPFLEIGWSTCVLAGLYCHPNLQVIFWKAP